MSSTRTFTTSPGFGEPGYLVQRDLPLRRVDEHLSVAVGMHVVASAQAAEFEFDRPAVAAVDGHVR
jgi:hypothetical protein